MLPQQPASFSRLCPQERVCLCGRAAVDVSTHTRALLPRDSEDATVCAPVARAARALCIVRSRVVRL